MKVSESIRIGCAMSLPAKHVFWGDKDGKPTNDKEDICVACVYGAFLLGSPDGYPAGWDRWRLANQAFFLKFGQSMMPVNDYSHHANLIPRRNEEDIRLDIADALEGLGQ